MLCQNLEKKKFDSPFIAHRDLKPENLGFTFGGDAKIIDMGSAKIMLDRVKHSHEVCTLLYRAPELLLVNQDYTLGQGWKGVFQN